MRISILFLSFLFLLPGIAAVPQHPANDSEPEGVARARNDDRRREVAQMRVLMEQMQRNLAQVSTGQTALKHQFELDIRMWQIVLSRLERESGSATDKK